MKIVAIKEFDNTKSTPLLPLVPEPTKVADKDDLTLIEISTRPGVAGAAKVKVSIKILEGLEETPRELIAWCKSVECASIGLSCATGTHQIAALPQCTRGFAWATLKWSVTKQPKQQELAKSRPKK